MRATIHDPETLAGVRPAAGMRNILTHLYSSVDPVKVHQAATVGLALPLVRLARPFDEGSRAGGPDR